MDLSDNNLVKFPGHLMQLSNRLDLSSNKIRTLSWTALKKVDWDRDQQLLLDCNPLCYPPQDVCQSGLKTIMQFFQESQADVKVSVNDQHTQQADTEGFVVLFLVVVVFCFWLLLGFFWGGMEGMGGEAKGHN